MAARNVPVNAQFAAALDAATGGGAGLTAGMYAALGVPYGEHLDPAWYPVLGFYLQVSSEQFLAYVLTPGRFVRYEVDAAQQSLTVAVPASRITRVAEKTSTDRLELVIELDADGMAVAGESNGAQFAGRLGRSGYALVASTQAQATELATFAIALRNILGS